jgi:predicted esterase YcpF (UPF0227 family)
MIVYLHGFGSSGNSQKADALKAVFGEDQVFAPDLPVDPNDVVDLIKDQVFFWYLADRDIMGKLVFVGTSLGAFYATYFAHTFDAPAVIVNPSSKPHETLKKVLGRNINCVTAEEFWLTLGHLEELERMRNYLTNNYMGALIHLFVAKDDEIIPYEQMLDWYKYTASTHIEETGGHRFTEHWNKVVDKVKELS